VRRLARRLIRGRKIWALAPDVRLVILVAYAQPCRPAVIVRVLRARVRSSKVATFDTLIRQQAKTMRGQPGLEYVKLARRIEPDGSEEVILFEEWRDAQSMYAWVGPNLSQPRLVEGARDLVDELAVTHYEALDRDSAFNDLLADIEGDDEEPEHAARTG
jgi:quinol monooxygenase YgiN